MAPRRRSSASTEAHTRSIGHRTLATALLAAACALLAACDGPVGPLPGGRLRGEDAPCPVDWRERSTEREVELEVAPEAPRSVRIWNVVESGRLYVPGDFLTPGKRWPHQVIADPRVRLRIAGELFRCEARRVSDPARIDTLRREAARKYALEPDGWAARSEVWWFELQPRAEDAPVRASETR